MNERRVQPWTPAEDERLRKFAAEGRTLVTIAERLKRSGAQTSADDANLMAKAERCRLYNVRERLQPILASFENAAAPGGR